MWTKKDVHELKEERRTQKWVKKIGGNEKGRRDAGIRGRYEQRERWKR